MKTISSLILLTFLAVSTYGQQPDDPIGHYLFPPELIMGHSGELGLQEAQRNAIKGEVQKAQSKFIDLQWDAKEQTEKMTQLLQQAPVNETRVLEQADKIMAIEREIKKAQLTLLIRMKNVLTAAQIEKLDAIRKNGR